MDLGRFLRPIMLVPALLGLLLGAALMTVLRPAEPVDTPDVERLAADALISVREQGRMTPFVGRFVAVVSAQETRFGMRAQKTLVMPGTVRYGVDLSRLRSEHLGWDEATATLAITLPPLEISGPSIDLNEVREYGEGGIVMALTDAEEALDQANRRNGQQELMRQARQPVPMGLARETAMRTVARSFAMPLRAAGVDASVVVRFVDPAGREEASFLDRPRRTEDAIKDRQAAVAPPERRGQAR